MPFSCLPCAPVSGFEICPCGQSNDHQQRHQRIEMVSNSGIRMLLALHEEQREGRSKSFGKKYIFPARSPHFFRAVHLHEVTLR
jgi:hypothetical protein